MEAFGASLRSVGTAATLTAAGWYLHEKKAVTRENKIVLSRFCHTIALPALFFSKMVYCQQNGSNLQCPNIVQHLNDCWILMIWPFYTIAIGLFMGIIATHYAGTPHGQKRRAAIAAIGFANSNALPLTLLGSVHDSITRTLGREVTLLEPSLLISLYCTAQPILMWGIAGWLLSPEDEDKNQSKDKQQQSHASNSNDEKDHHSRSGLVVEDQQQRIITHHDNSNNNDDVVYLSYQNKLSYMSATSTDHELSSPSDVSSSDHSLLELGNGDPQQADEKSALISPSSSIHDDDDDVVKSSSSSSSEFTKALKKIFEKALQPPSMGVLFGLIFTGFAFLRSLFVNLETRRGGAPLEWMFDGIHILGRAQVPVSMTVLGINLSLAAQAYRNPASASSSTSSSLVPPSTLATIVVCKLIFMPIIGILSTIVVKTWIMKDVSEDLGISLWLVLMTEFVTPTATNVMIIADVYGSSAKEGMAQIIGCQYIFAPILLSISMMAIVHVATT